MTNNSNRNNINFIPRLAKRRNLLLICLLSFISIIAFFFFYTSKTEFLSIHSPFNWFNPSLAPYQSTKGQPVQQHEILSVSSEIRPPIQHQMESLSSFLKRSKQEAIQHLNRDKVLQDGLVIIMGNEAGDLDSVASAISLSYFLSNLPLHSVQSSSTSTFDFSTPKYVPLLQLERKDLSLRQENLALLQSLNISPSDLLFIDDLDSFDLKKSQRFSPGSNTFLGLVDHPSLSTRFGGPLRDSDQLKNSDLERKVVIVIDHHQDEENHSKASLRIIKGPNDKDETSGSAISLVIDLFRNQLENNSNLPKELVYLGLGAIIIDTDNLKLSPLGKAKALDLNSHRILSSLSNFSNGSATSFTPQNVDPDPNSFNPIRSLKNSLSKFQTSSILTLPSINLENSPPPSDDESLPSDNVRPSQSKETHEFWKLLSGLKSQVNHLNTRQLLKRDLKTENFFLPQEFGSNYTSVGQSQVVAEEDDENQLKLKVSYSSVPLGLTEWLHRNTKGSDGKESYKLDWENWWDEVENWMKEEKINLAIILNSFREKKAGGSERGKHRRELIVVFLPPPNSIIPLNLSTQLFSNFLNSLLSDSHANPTDLTSRLLLEYPWKGLRFNESDKKQKVVGLEEGLGGKRIRLKDHDGNGDGEMFGMVFKQTNQKANRKIVVPAVNHALKEALSKVKGIQMEK